MAKTVGAARREALAHPLVAAIVEADDIEYEDVPVPEWGGITVRVQGLSGEGRDAYESRIMALRQAIKNGEMTAELNLTNRRAWLVSRCLYAPASGERLPISAEDLGKKSGRVLDRLTDIAERLSGLGPESREAARGNSGAAQSGSSTSA